MVAEPFVAARTSGDEVIRPIFADLPPLSLLDKDLWRDILPVREIDSGHQFGKTHCIDFLDRIAGELFDAGTEIVITH